jgi:N6-adenosine-specific RNA methylase IME4
MTAKKMIGKITMNETTEIIVIDAETGVEMVEQNWYQSLVEDCKAIITEAVFNSRWALVEGYHQLGKRIAADENYQWHAKGNLSYLKDLSNNVGVSERRLYSAVQFYNKYPDLSKVPEGKNISWNKILTKYLPKPVTVTPALPEGTFNVVVIDPPWPEQVIARETRPNQIDFDYERGMSLEEIAEIVPPFAPDTHVWLWTTQKYLPYAFEIFKAWGVKYVCTFNWHKAGGFQPFGLPQYNNEFVLYGRIGSPVFVDTKNFKTSFEGRRGEHSEKPQEFYDMVCRVTAGRRLDMFNRRKIEGFEGWGLEAK